MTIRVWAPRARRVRLEAGLQSVDMSPEPNGWWSSGGVEVAAGDRYAFSLDGGPPRPDPRATRLPDGVHGLAQVVDHGAFSWTDAAWRPRPLRDAVIYELHVGTYSPEGTFDGALARLDHLVRLGVSHVELMPVHAFPGTHGWGYDPAGLYAVHEPYGGPDGLKRLVDACHARGLAVLLDVIYNHLGPEGNYLGEFGPYVTDRFRTPWGGAINLGEAGADDVRRFIVDNALAWLRDYHIDGLRIDAVHAFADFTAVHLLEQMAVEVAELERTLGRPLTLIAESDLNDPRLLWPRERGGYGLHAQWSDDFHHALHSTLTGERDGYYEDFQGLPDLASALERTWVYDGRYSRHRGRAHGRPPTGLAMDRFLGYAQNHDQVGNRAAGERLSQLVDPSALKIAAALVLCGPFIPMLFQGEEWGASTPFQFFVDYGDESLREATRVGRRQEFAAFGWPEDRVPDPSDPGTLQRSRLDWAESSRPPHAGLLEWHRTLIALRAALPGLRDGAPPVIRCQPDEGWLAMERAGVTVAVNTSRDDRVIPLRGSDTVLLACSEDGVEAVAGGSVRLPGMSAAIMGADPGVPRTPAARD